MQAGDPSVGARSEASILEVNADDHVDTCDGTRKGAGSLLASASRPTTSDADTGAHVGAPGAKVPAGAEVTTASQLDAAILCSEARAALTGLGWKPAIARAAVEAAFAARTAEMTLERLIFESLQRCPTPKA